MARQFEHVRFRLTHLIAAARKAMKLDANPSTQEALSFYWNWAANRGWALQEMSAQFDNHGTPILTIESTKQVELRTEEFWNVVWSGEGADGSPNLVEEMGIPTLDPLPELERQVVDELRRRGWVELEGGDFGCPGFETLMYIDIAETCGDLLRSDMKSDVSKAADKLEKERREG